MKKYFLFLLFFILGFASTQSQRLRSCNQNYNVIDYGAVGDGDTDDTQAFLNAWKAVCKSSSCSSPMVLVPAGRTFLIQPLTFNGNCEPNEIIFQIDGTIRAPSDPHDWECDGKSRCKQWITFHEVNNLVIRGTGTIDGHGSKWWNHPDCDDHKDKRVCGRKPTGLIISNCENVQMDGLTFKDSPQMHMALERSEWVYVSNLSIQAPGDSPNTDGIHLQHSKNIFINHNTIMTGDDCISIGDGSAYINITEIACGPGHGISIGSLGEDGSQETVEFVHVSHVLFNGTTNGARIKTWQGGKGFARNIVFENIRSEGSRNPIIIDQFYCDHKHCTDHDDAVKISNVRYENIRGTAHKRPIVKLQCSDSVPCNDIVLRNIDLQSAAADGDDVEEPISLCENVRGYSSGHVFPTLPCPFLNS